jgi:hypothetical protein
LREGFLTIIPQSKQHTRLFVTLEGC